MLLVLFRSINRHWWQAFLDKQTSDDDDEEEEEEGEEEDDDDEEEEEDDDDDEDEEEEDDHQNFAGAGQTVVYWCRDCCQVIFDIFQLNIFVCSNRFCYLWLGYQKEFDLYIVFVFLAKRLREATVLTCCVLREIENIGCLGQN